MSAALDAVFTPRRVVLVGASDRPDTLVRLLWDNLRTFPGEVVPVGRAASIDGVAAYADLREVPGPIDLAVIGVPAERVLDAVQAAATLGIPAAVVLSAGFAETGPAGAALQSELVAAARAGGLRVVGPNCMGIQNCDLPPSTPPSPLGRHRPAPLAGSASSPSPGPTGWRCTHWAWTRACPSRRCWPPATRRT